MSADMLERLLGELAELRRRVEQLEQTPRVVYVPMPVAVAPPAPPPPQPIQCPWCYRFDCRETHTICASDSAPPMDLPWRDLPWSQSTAGQTLSSGRVLATAFPG